MRTLDYEYRLVFATAIPIFGVGLHNCHSGFVGVEKLTAQDIFWAGSYNSVQYAGSKYDVLNLMHKKFMNSKCCVP